MANRRRRQKRSDKNALRPLRSYYSPFRLWDSGEATLNRPCDVTYECYLSSRQNLSRRRSRTSKCYFDVARSTRTENGGRNNLHCGRKDSLSCFIPQTIDILLREKERLPALVMRILQINLLSFITTWLLS